MANQTPLLPRQDADPHSEHDADPSRSSNPGQRHSDDLFDHLEREFNNPTVSSIGEDAAIDRARAATRDELADAEAGAATQAGTRQDGSLADRERMPNDYNYKPRMGQARNQTKQEIKNAKLRSQSSNRRRRGIFIGLGAGGGLLSVVAGFTALLPLKLPGIMDTLVNDAGKRIEQVVERRAEKVLLTYILRGSSVALKNGAVIVTGNPIGDLFANIRTSRFEKELYDKYGLEFEPGPNKSVKIKMRGATLGDFADLNRLEQYLNRDGLTNKEFKKAVKIIVKNEIPAWRFWKRAKFVNWLRLKYHIPRWGAREQQEGEKDEDYKKSIAKDHASLSNNASIQNMEDFIDCVAEDGDCGDADKVGQGDQMTEEARKALDDAAEETAEKVSKEGAQKGFSIMSKLAINKLLVTGAGVAIPYVGWIDLAARLMHGLGNVVSDDVLQKKHAEYIKRSTAVLGASYAGYADQTKAGDLPAGAVGMFASNFDGWEASASYGIIQASAVGGPVVGTMLDPMQRAQESVDLPAFADVVKTMFGTVGWVGRAPLEAWYYTVSQLFDLAGDLLGDAIGWIVEHTPAKSIVAQLQPVMESIFEGLMKLFGMYVDPFTIGDELAMLIHQGFLGAFNDKGKEDGMRKLSESQGLQVDAGIRQEHIAALQDMSLFDRLFNVHNTDSLAAHLVTTMPSDTRSPVGSLTSATARMVANTPYQLARATSGTAIAATPTQTSESLFGLNIYGGLPSDLSADLDNSVMQAEVKCPENSDNNFNHCIVDRSVVESMNCVFIKCADMKLEASTDTASTMFAADLQPLYGPDAPAAPPKATPTGLPDWAQAGAMLAAALPVAALELSRRRL